jgi:hypothetical protein
MRDIGRQLEIHGLTETLRQAEGEGSAAQRLRRRVETTHDLLSSLPSQEDLSFLHSGLAQTFLPHSRPADNTAIWRRSAGRFKLIVSPGVIDGEGQAAYVGVPYGTRARLILIYLQTEGVRSRTVSLGPNLSAFLRSLGLQVTGGRNGTISAVREQCLRIARCTFTMQWSDRGADGSERMLITDTRIAEGLDLWRAARGDGWSATLELSEKFHEALREHAVPLDRRGIALLSSNSMGLDLYALLAYRLPKLARETHIRWESLLTQIGSEYSTTRHMAWRVREVLPDVLTAYPGAKVEATSTGLTLWPSVPAVPRPIVQGFRLVEGS